MGKWGLSAGTGKLCIFGHLGLVFIWSCFVSCLLLLLYYVICAPVLTEGTEKLSEPSIVKYIENQSEHFSKFVFKKISVPSVSTGAQIT